MTLAPARDARKRPSKLDFRTLIDILRSAAGWRAGGFACLAGVAAALSMAPFYLLPLLAVGLSALVLLFDGASGRARSLRAAFFRGWCFGFGYFLVGLYWLGFAFLVQAESFAWMAPFAVLGMPAFLGLFFGVAGAVALHFWRPGWSRILTLTACLAITEFLRGHILTGLPWNLPGQAFAGLAAGGQTAAWYGAYGLSIVTLILATAPAATLDQGASRRWIGVGVAIAGTLALYGVGSLRLALSPTIFHEDAAVRIVQPNIPQREKIDWDLWWRNLDIHLDLSDGLAPSSRTFVIWPENAAPSLNESAEALMEIDRRIPSGATLIYGTARRETDVNGRDRYFNSIAIAPPGGGRAAAEYYDKHHLAPFGEYLPFQGLLRAAGLAQLAPYDDGFTKGDGPAVIISGGLSFAPLICFEAVFPNDIHPPDNRPDWIVTVTNDAWFGDTSGPRQHLDQARLRAIETGLPMARSANTGVSALIDPAGRYIARVPLYEPGVIDAALPKSLPPTTYSRFGDGVFWAMVILVVLASRLAGRRSGN